MNRAIRHVWWKLIAVAGTLGYDITRDMKSGRLSIRKRLRLGRDHYSDLRIILDSSVSTILDIGANVGQSAVAFRKCFPGARIISVEPDPSVFETLLETTHSLKIDAVQAAVGDTCGVATFYRHNFDQTSSLLPNAAHAANYVVSPELMAPIGEITVPVTTIDTLCAERGIEDVDILKIDTQGYELKVMAGAIRLLDPGRIKAIYVEVCFVPTYDEQPLFPEIYSYLFERGYRMVGIYESGFATHYYQVGGNALFIREDLGQRRGRHL